jgi:hypothetical protein
VNAIKLTWQIGDVVMSQGGRFHKMWKARIG